MPFQVDVQIIDFLPLLVNLDRAFEVLKEKGVGYNHVAFGLRALRYHAPRAFRLHLVFQELCPTKPVVLMAALELVWPPTIFVFKFTKANLAGVLIVCSEGLIHLLVFFSDALIKLKTYFQTQTLGISEPAFVNFVLAPLEVPQDGQHVVV